MPIPDFQTVMLPILKIAGDQREHSVLATLDEVAKEFELSADEKEQLLPSGRQTRFRNRVTWAISYLKNAGVLVTAGRGKFKVTPRGLEVLSEKPQRIDITFLERFQEFREFRGRTSDGEQTNPTPLEPALQTPEESIESSYQRLRRDLAQELIQRVRACSPRFFEKLVVDLMIAMGYGGSRADAGERLGRSGDGGVDGVIKEDKLGLDTIYLQAKRWEATVGRPIVQAFAGSLEGHRARKGVLITTSAFSPDANEYVTRIEKKIVLIDGVQLAQLMIDHGLGVTEVSSYTIKKMDSDYFDDSDS